MNVLKGLFKCQIDAYLNARINLNKHEYYESETLPVGYAIKRLSSYSEYQKYQYSVVNKKFINRFLRGDVCFVIIYKSEIIGYTWLGFTKAFLNHGFSKNIIKIKQVDANKFALVHDVYINPSHRGLKGQNALLTNILNFLHDSSSRIEELHIIIGINNLASLINASRKFDEFRTFVHIRIDLPLFNFDFYPKLKPIWKLLPKKI